MKEIENMVNDSAECNVSQLVADEDGNVIVPTFDWTDFFATRMKRFVGIKKYHHFRFDSSDPGVVTVKLHSDSVEEMFYLLKQPWIPDLSELPNIVSPKSLSTERRWYLFDQIRQFCSDNAKDKLLQPFRLRQQKSLLVKGHDSVEHANKQAIIANLVRPKNNLCIIFLSLFYVL